jgi:hypothetical protein
MKRKPNYKIFWTLVFMVLINYQAFTQENNNWAKEHISFSGYIKFLNIGTFQDFDAMLNDNLLHNRLNLKIYLDEHFTVNLELRNRALWGDSVRLIPNYASSLDNGNQDIDLSLLLVDKPALLVHSKIDRLSLNYQSDKWRFTIGRQRINWGKNLVWNPNDLFNTYSFFDFDNEERPGTDALRIQYFTSGNSSVETAVNYRNNWDDTTLALKYNFNKFSYDFQVLAAKYFDDYMMGIGWEGAVKDIGVKGEFSYFIPQDRAKESLLSASVSLDYYFKNGISLTASTLFNENGVKEVTAFNPVNFNSFQLNAKNLMPNRWSSFLQISKTPTPAVNLSFATIYAYEIRGFFMMPQFSYSLSQNWDFDTTAQIFYGKPNDKLENIANSVFLRFRWSF